ncbi:MAG: hypothetical protein HYS34_02575 [Acidobacteria bacterium]|nr:hypothetical protein [Acidobacteriota bacterium]
MNRPLKLALLLACLPLPFLIPGAPGLLGGQGAYREAMTWGLPVAAVLLGSFVFSRWPGFSGSRGAPGGRRAVPHALPRLAPWFVAALLADFSFLGIGHLLGWVTFTFGDQGFSGHPVRTLLWSLPLCLLVAALGWEWTLRGTLLAALAERVPPPAALLLSCASGVWLAAPLIVPGLDVPDPHYVLAAFLTAACREVSFALVFMSGAGLAAAGIYRGLILYLDAFVINDWYSVHFPAANFTSSEPAFYLLRSLSAVLAAALVALGAHLAHRRGRRA